MVGTRVSIQAKAVSMLAEAASAMAVAVLGQGAAGATIAAAMPLVAGVVSAHRPRREQGVLVGAMVSAGEFLAIMPSE
jgi:hypothetical protein